MKAPFTAALLAFSAALLAGFTQNTEGNKASPVSLKFNFKVNSKFSYTAQTAQNIDVQGNKMTQDLVMGNTFVVLASKGTSKDLRVTYGRVAMKMDAGGQQMRYDSQDSTTKSSPMGSMLGSMIGKSLVITLTDQGEVTAVKGVEELKKSILANNSNAAMSQQLSQSLNDNTIISSMNQLFNIYPDHAVKPGESWTKNTTLTMGPTSVKLASTYQLGSVQNGVAHLLVTGKLSVEGTAALTGTQSGTMDVDVATGLVLTSKFKQAMSSQVSSSAMSLASDITVTGKKL